MWEKLRFLFIFMVGMVSLRWVGDFVGGWRIVSQKNLKRQVRRERTTAH